MFKHSVLQRFVGVFTIALFAVFGLAGTATAGSGGGNPHFVNASAALSGPNLVVSFKEAGLGHKQPVKIRAFAKATVTYGCVKHWKVKSQKTATVRVKSNLFKTTANGQVTGSVTLRAPSAAAIGLHCGKHKKTKLLFIKWRCVRLVDFCTGARTAIPGRFVWKATKDDCGCKWAA